MGIEDEEGEGGGELEDEGRDGGSGRGIHIHDSHRLQEL